MVKKSTNFNYKKTEVVLTKYLALKATTTINMNKMCRISTDSISRSNLLGYNQSREWLNFRFMWSSQDRMRIG